MDTSNVKSMTFLFGYGSVLNYLDLTNFNAQSVTDISFMLSECWLLESLDLSNFDTSNVLSMQKMFA